jgi:hypothetical protein
MPKPSLSDSSAPGNLAYEALSERVLYVTPAQAGVQDASVRDWIPASSEDTLGPLVGRASPLAQRVARGRATYEDRIFILLRWAE